MFSGVHFSPSREQVVKYLFSQGADIFIKDVDGNSALALAVDGKTHIMHKRPFNLKQSDDIFCI